MSSAPCTGNALTCRIELDEDERLTVYDDATGLPITAGYTVRGNPTIGYGTLLAAPGGITHEEASSLLDNRIRQARAQAERVPGFGSLPPARQNVLIEMVFQLGFKGVMGFHEMIAAIRRGDFDAASKAMLDSRWARETPARAELLAKIMRNGA